jgi:L-lactate dehydrogenase complex protein LldE
MANAGFESKAFPLALSFERLFERYEYIVAPSASCAAFIRFNYPKVLKEGGHPCQTSGRIYEVCEFIHDVLRPERLPGIFPHKVSLHNSCHGVRELKLSSAGELNVPRYSKIKDLLNLVQGIEVVEPEKFDECCGFGGMFSVEEPEVSTCMGEDKIRDHLATGAAYITGADSSCLMHIQGIAGRRKLSARFIHVVQILSAGL